MIVAAVAVAACSGSAPKPATPALGAAPTTTAERILGLLPAGVQIVAEIDLARIRANPVVGGIAKAAFGSPEANAPSGQGFALPGGMAAPPLAHAELVVLAAYGVGTAEAATLTIIASPHPIDGATRVSDGIYAIGPESWVAQLEQRAVLTAEAPVGAPADLLELRDRAMPPKAPGASLRLTAQLAFDARVALARQVGLENAPGQVSVWGDVVDDIAIVIDADSSDPGEPATKQSVARLEATMRGALTAIAALPAVRVLGLTSSLQHAKLTVRGTWVRTIVAVGPAHLSRVVERAEKLLAIGAAQPEPSQPEPPTSGPQRSHPSRPRRPCGPRRARRRARPDPYIGEPS